MTEILKETPRTWLEFIDPDAAGTLIKAAIEFLESKDLKSIWQNALGAAIKRAEEISKN